MWGGVESHAYLAHGFDSLCTGLQLGRKPPRPEVRGRRDVSAAQGSRCRTTCIFRVIPRQGLGKLRAWVCFRHYNVPMYVLPDSPFSAPGGGTESTVSAGTPEGERFVGPQADPRKRPETPL